MLAIGTFFHNRKYFAPAFLYSCFSLVFSTWVTYIPYIADKLNITEGRIGGALFFTSLGSLTMIPVTNRIIEKAGVGKLAFTGFVCYALSMYGMFLAPTYPFLCLALYCFGLMSAVFAVSLNSMTAVIEKQAGTYIMTGSHGFWSIGGMIGATTGSFVAGWLKMPLLHITLLVLILITIQLFLRKEYFHIRVEPSKKEKHLKIPFKPLIAIASIGLIMMVSEGAIADWSALYLKKIVRLGLPYIGLGYALFSMGMTIGRFMGDSLSHRLGSWKLLRLAIGFSLVGFALVLTKFPSLSLAGFFIIGLGFSIIVPEIYRMASVMPGIHTTQGVSFVAVTGNIGFLTGPVLLGYIAELQTLHLSFIALTIFVGTAFTITIFKR